VTYDRMSPYTSDVRACCTQPTPAAALKRSRSSTPDVLPQLLSFPVGVWEDHLLPQLMPKDAARLMRTCKALREVTREHFTKLGTIKLWKLQAALTSFPRARTVVLENCHREWDDKGRKALLRWLCTDERGKYLEELSVGDVESPAIWFVRDAVLSGALPSIKRVDWTFGFMRERDGLTDGLLRGLHELRVDTELRRSYEGVDPQLEALGLVGQLPALAKLEVRVLCEEDEPMEWPLFIPPSLKALTIDVSHDEIWPTFDHLLPALPSLLAASGARLDRLELRIHDDIQEVVDGLVPVAQVLRRCSSTLKEFLLKTDGYGYEDENSEEYKVKVKWLRVPWADVLAGVSACHELQVLVLPRIKAEPLFPPGTVFNRLIHLEIPDNEREHPTSAGVMGLWELMASGGLPALAKLRVTLEDRWGDVEDVRTRLAPAFEAVAGTLTHFSLVHEWLSDDVKLGYEFGVAMGKLRRLKDLALNLSMDGRFYHALAQGLAASGGERPLPLLWCLRVGMNQHVDENVDRLASLLLPSVRVFASTPDDCQQTSAILTACALRQAGYKHNWALQSFRDGYVPPAGLGSFRIVHVKFKCSADVRPSWTLLNHW
jgi:hypothetical protein